jgi:hypothetical protein
MAKRSLTHRRSLGAAQRRHSERRLIIARRGARSWLVLIHAASVYVRKYAPSKQAWFDTSSSRLIFQPVESGWTQARIAQIPGVITAVPSRAEARTLVLDALHEYLGSLEAEPLAPGVDSESIELLINA